MQFLTKTQLLLKHWTLSGRLGGNSFEPCICRTNTWRNMHHKLATQSHWWKTASQCPHRTAAATWALRMLLPYHISHYSILSTSASVTKIQVDLSEESIVSSLLQVTLEQFVCLVLLLLLFYFSNGYLKKLWCFNTYTYCKSQSLVRIHMNNTQFTTKHENEISVPALLCGWQFR